MIGALLGAVLALAAIVWATLAGAAEKRAIHELEDARAQYGRDHLAWQDDLRAVQEASARLDGLAEQRAAQIRRLELELREGSSLEAERRRLREEAGRG